jgi:hypothetical protein
MMNRNYDIKFLPTLNLWIITNYSDFAHKPVYWNNARDNQHPYRIIMPDLLISNHQYHHNLRGWYINMASGYRSKEEAQDAVDTAISNEVLHTLSRLGEE